VTDLVDPDDPPDEATDHDELTDDEKTALRCELDDLLPRGEAAARSVAAGAASAGEASD
jgi:hypothetical protein